LSRSIVVRAILLVLVLPIFAVAQESPGRNSDEGAELRNPATLTTADTLDPKDFAKPAVTPREEKAKKPGAVKALVVDPEPEKILRSEVIETVEGQIPVAVSKATEASLPPTGEPKLDALISSAAAKYGLDPRLIVAVMRQESSFNPRAVSPKGARGLMQLMPATARRFGVRDILDPAQNIDGGAQYLRFLLDTFNGDVELALAGYNAGENAVARYGNRVPPYRETMDYVQRIGAHYSRLRNGAGVRPVVKQMQVVAERRNDAEVIGGVRSLAQY